ncbi:MAG: PP2C family protein-serine/threonine phosphatase [Spirochaetes bacterium]|nr:PP2C family protein-serine/threonine phosphatase [Spirochaetota bacterium]
MGRAIQKKKIICIAFYMDQSLKLVKRKYRLNYSSRLAWSISLLGFGYQLLPPLLLIFLTFHISINIVWIILVETESPIIFFEQLRYVRITLDSIMYTLLVFITGSIYSFCLLSYVIFVIVASLYTTPRYGIYAIVNCLLFYNLMLYLQHKGILPFVHLLTDMPLSSFSLTPFQLFSTNFTLIITSVIMHIIAFRLYRTLIERTKELQIERNLLHQRNLTIEKDLKLAKRIQKQLIPQENPRPYIHTLYFPMFEVGGDFYDFIEFRNSAQIGIFISDVSGHGVPAAFITSMIKTIILQLGQVRENPAAALMHLNENLYGKTADNFITAFYCIYDNVNRTLKYANAGHNPPFLLQNSKISKIDEPRSVPLAFATNKFLFEKGKTYQNATISLQKGDKLILYTDGLIEQKGYDGIHESFEDVMIDEILPTLYNLNSKQIIQTINSRFAQWIANDHLADDVCVICLEIF